MTKAFYILSFLLVFHFNSFSQTSVNDYKYIVIPNHYDFLKEKDQYQINSLTKFLFNKYGYEAYMQDEEFPEDLQVNRCLALTADVFEESALLKTKLRIDLKDCNGNVIKSSKVGESREKEYAKAYNSALRNAFETYQHLSYNYQPNASILSKASTTTAVKIITSEQDEITRLKQEIKSLKQDNIESVEVSTPNKVSTPKEIEATKIEPTKIKSDALYAQSIENGFQVVDGTPKVVMILLATSAKEVFLVKDKNAVVFKNGNQWMYSEINGNKVKENSLNIKF